MKVKEQKVANARLIESTMQAASLFLLATVPFAAADIIGDGTRKYASQGACYDPTTHLAITRRLYFPIVRPRRGRARMTRLATTSLLICILSS